MKKSNKKVLKITVVLLSISLLFAIIWLCLDTSIYSLFDIQGEVGPLAHKIMDNIDQEANAEGECILDISKITDFEWDKMIITDILCPLGTIRYITGDFDFKQTKGSWTHLFFIKKDEVVYKESYRASVETSYKFNLFFEYGGQNYKVFTIENPQIIGRRFVNPKYSENDSNAPYYYSLII